MSYKPVRQQLLEIAARPMPEPVVYPYPTDVEVLEVEGQEPWMKHWHEGWDKCVDTTPESGIIAKVKRAYAEVQMFAAKMLGA